MTESRGKPNRQSYKRIKVSETVTSVEKFMLDITYTLNRVALLLCDRNRLGAGGQSLVVLTKVLSKQLEELFRILPDDLGNLGVASGDLLQDRLKHLGLLLYQLTELLEVGVAAKEIQVRITTSRTGTSPTTTTATLTSLSSSLEHVERLLSSSSTTSSGGLSTSLGLLLLLLLMLLLLALGALGDTLKRDSLDGKGGGYEMTA